ncbi:YceI family protein [Larkinella arboricola]|uniref:Polyisoprenoid-binding protein YceI n=1 Tax=Larkinella arboricola TaxID=643671 RepID=A0A327XC00_LARAB|nr:YceI family protein [Larkinella arboricola]RAK03162.1 polyisoprenoid-binding protein YceI [Larkinella arboricola]
MATTAQETKVWTIDPTHSEIQFKVRHLMVSNVTGKFNSFEGQVETAGDDFSNASVSFSADIDSITTGNEQRDGHLKSADFFDAANHPKLTFQSTDVKKISDDEYEIKGDLTIRGTTKPVTLKAEYGGQMGDFYGNTKAGFELTGTIKRKEFGLSWDAVTEAGGVVVSDDVKLLLNVQVARQ